MFSLLSSVGLGIQVDTIAHKIVKKERKKESGQVLVCVAPVDKVHQGPG